MQNVVMRVWWMGGACQVVLHVSDWCNFTQADVNGLKWVRYVGPNSPTSLEAPKDDPVLMSYARLLNQG